MLAGAKVVRCNRRVVPQRLIPSRSHGQETTYELHTLGWKAFQDLCVTVVADIWGQTIQSYFGSNDGGRDGAFRGVWKTKAGEAFDGAFTVQCKFTSKRDHNLTLSDLADELTKARRLAAQGLADNYLLFTNAALSGANEERIKAAFEGLPGLRCFAAYGRESISRMIRESPRLRMLVPRIYGLGDLSQILDERAYAQAREILSALGDDLRKFVITEAYQKSAKALIDHGFVLLLGEAACGKSTIAAALSVGALDEWGHSTIKVRNAEDFVRHSNPYEPRQLFWIDDAFGATQIDWQATYAWNSAFPHIQAAINRGAKVLFTSRDYIYRSAKSVLKQTALPLLRESQVVIHVEQLTKREREQILYNHVRLGRQSVDYKKRIREFLPGIAAHPRFTPEIARRLGNPSFTRSLVMTEDALADFVERPLELTSEVIRTLDVESKAALGLVFMRGGFVPSPLSLTTEEETAVTLMGGTVAGVRTALGNLDESFVLRVLQGSGHVWKFKHPSIRDAFAVLVAADPELLDIYLAGTPLEDLMDEVSCGDLGIEGVKVIVPPDRFDALINRLGTLVGSTPRALYLFLSRRCNAAFLREFLRRFDDFVDRLEVGSYLYCCSELDVLLRLHEFRLLPEAIRARSVEAITTLALETPDSGCFIEGVPVIFTAEELETLRYRLETELFANLDETIWNWRSNYEARNGEPSDYFDELVSALDSFEREFAKNAKAVAQLREAKLQIKETVADMESEHPEREGRGTFSRDNRSHDSSADGRSVFDDVAD